MSLLSKINETRDAFEKAISQDSLNESHVERLKNEYLARKGRIATLFSQLGSVDAQDRPEIGN